MTAAGAGGQTSWYWVPLMLLAGLLIVSHGCHAGDHDDELSVAPPQAVDEPDGR